MKTINISGRRVGADHPCFIIAEVGINHNGDVSIAKKMIAIAKECGVDAVKFQTFKANEFVSDKKQTYTYESKGRKVTESMYEMFKRYELTAAEFATLARYCRRKEIVFFSTPQNISDLDILLRIGIPAIKVGSDDMNNLPLLRDYARRGLPIFISTGMSYLTEVAESVELISRHNRKIGILLCVSSYPADLSEVNLNRLHTLRSHFPDAVIGYSDHTQGILAAVGAVCLGAKIIEKHFTLDKNMPGPDHRFSADPGELMELVTACRNMEEALGTQEYNPSRNELKMRRLCRRSIVARNDIKKGSIIAEEDVDFKRPGWGMPPKEIDGVIGRQAMANIEKDQIIKKGDIK